MSDVPEKLKVYCGVKLAAQLDRLMEQGINPLVPIDPWPVICSACEGEPRRIMQVGESLPFAVIISMIGRHDEAHVYCKACDGKGTTIQ